VSLLEVEDLEAGYGPVTVLRDVSFSVEEGHVVAILGANGAGKTTTLRALSGTVRTHGQIRFGGRELSGRAPEARVRAGIAHIPEGRGNFAPLTVRENLRLGAYVRRDRAGVHADMERCLQHFPRLGERLDQTAGSLSGGEQQMLAIARGLMLAPRLLLLDEPSHGLSPLFTREVLRILETISREQGTTVLIVEQNANLVLRFADHAYVLETGRVVLAGPAAEIAADEGVRRSYLGMV
jgi:branched-chain amino acid transport system ATP-binding protein